MGASQGEEDAFSAIKFNKAATMRNFALQFYA
jgi:hypothetical protein